MTGSRNAGNHKSSFILSLNQNHVEDNEDSRKSQMMLRRDFSPADPEDESHNSGKKEEKYLEEPNQEKVVLEQEKVILKEKGILNITLMDGETYKERDYDFHLQFSHDNQDEKAPK